MDQDDHRLRAFQKERLVLRATSSEQMTQQSIGPNSSEKEKETLQYDFQHPT